MAEHENEYERRKKAIFDGMSKRGQQRILRVGYENWDPFQEPKDPREQIRSSSAVKAGMLLKEFQESCSQVGEIQSYYRELFELCRGFIRQEPRARVILEFCKWYIETQSERR